MPITYQINAHPDAAEVCALTVSVGWRDPARHGLDVVQRVWDMAPATVLARDGERLVGMCRAVWDGGLMAEIMNVVVHPDYQRQGIGRRLMELLIAEIEKLGVRHITLGSAVGKEAFYEQFGFVVRDTVTPMIKRYDDHGKGEDECCSRS